MQKAQTIKEKFDRFISGDGARKIFVSSKIQINYTRISYKSSRKKEKSNNKISREHEFTIYKQKN